jgi:hypothetical protein
LNGIVRTTTINNIIKEDVLLSTIELSHGKQTIKFLILFPILGLLIVLVFIMLGFIIIYRMKGNFYKTFFKKYVLLVFRFTNRSET